VEDESFSEVVSDIVSDAISRSVSETSPVLLEVALVVRDPDFDSVLDELRLYDP
jgi:hypothetical protein